MRGDCFIAVCAAVLIAGSAAAQKRAQPPAPAAPYKPVTIALPKPVSDESFDAMRKQLGEAAQRDAPPWRAWWSAHGFFWQRENRNAANKRKSGFDNLSAALGLDNKEGAGWEILSGYAEDPAAFRAPTRRARTRSARRSEPSLRARRNSPRCSRRRTDRRDRIGAIRVPTEHRRPRRSPMAARPVDRQTRSSLSCTSARGPRRLQLLILPVIAARRGNKIGYVSVDAIAPASSTDRASATSRTAAGLEGRRL